MVYEEAGVLHRGAFRQASCFSNLPTCTQRPAAARPSRRGRNGSPCGAGLRTEPGSRARCGNVAQQTSLALDSVRRTHPNRRCTSGGRASSTGPPCTATARRRALAPASPWPGRGVCRVGMWSPTLCSQVTASGSEKYVGEFDRGVRQGHGTCSYADGTLWAGQWDRGKRAGTCDRLEEPVAGGGLRCFSGGWAYGMRHGRGRQTEPDGSEYSGEWHRGLREGHGRETSSGGEVFEGAFLDGQRHGHGVLQRPGTPLSHSTTRLAPLTASTKHSTAHGPARPSCRYDVVYPSRARCRSARVRGRVGGGQAAGPRRAPPGR